MRSKKRTKILLVLMKIIMFYPIKKLVNYFNEDFVIKQYLFKANRVSGIKFPRRFSDKMFLVCNSSNHRYI